MAKALPNPADMTARWKAGVQSAGPRYAAGVQNYAGNPMQEAVAKQAKMVQNWNNVITSGEWAKRTGNTPVSYWKSQAQLAQAKYSQGATTGESKYVKFAQKAGAVYQQMRAAAVAAGDNPVARVTAALNTIMAAGRKQGGNGFSA